MGSTELAHQSTYSENTPRLPIMGFGIHPRADLRSLFPYQLSVSVQPRASLSLWSIRTTRGQIVAI